MKGVTDRCDSHVSVIVRYSHRHHKKAVIDAGDTYTCVQIGKPGRAASRDYFVKLSPPERDYDKVSANTASSVPKTSKFQIAHRVVKMVLLT